MILDRVVLVDDVDTHPVELRARILSADEWILAWDCEMHAVIAARGEFTAIIPEHRIRYMVPGVERSTYPPVPQAAEQPEALPKPLAKADRRRGR